MELFLQFTVLFIIIAFTASTYFKIYSLRHKVSCNTVMLATMVFSTMNGLIIGTILALTQSFSVNCILSMIVGLCTGIILGATFNLMTTVEGIMGGVMGGLMGAMLGTMLDFSYIYFLALTLLFILGGVTVCLIKLINQEAHTISNVESFPAKNSYLKKLTLGIAFSSLALFSGVLVATSHPVENDIPEVESHEHH